MKPEKNIKCHDNPEGCYTCECGKHHNCKDGAEKCCTDMKSIKCDCRHCK